MLRILVVDDEELIRKGLVKYITKADKNYEVVEASNGMDAIAVISENKTDVVLLDVTMPEMNGIELIRTLQADFPEVRKIVISGFKEFDYVRETMKYGALDYLLKPVDIDQLINLLRKIETDILSESERKSQVLKASAAVDEGLQLAKEQFLHELFFENKYTEDEIIKKFEKYQIGLINGTCFAMIASIDNYRNLRRIHGLQDAKTEYFIIRNIADEIIGSFSPFASFMDSQGYMAVISLPYEEADMPDKIVNEIYKNLVKFAPDIRFTLSAGLPADSLTNLHKSLDQALFALKFRFFNTKPGIVRYTDLEGRLRCTDTGDTAHASMEAIYTRLKNKIEILHSDHIDKILEEFCTKLKENSVQPTEAVRAFSDMFIKMQMSIPDFEKAVNELYGMEFSYAKQLDYFDTLDEINRYSYTLYTEIINRMKQIRIQKDMSIVEIIRKYVLKNYMEDIKLETIANITGLNSSYVCYLFRNQTGEHFIDYLTGVRIEKAKSLLRDIRITTYAVGDLVGYEDPTYFSKVFKKVVGISPSEYRKTMK